jgi:oligopeptide/dipeptide ABC transporter ATP-binding protein
MYLGKIVELADRRTLWRKPLHPYTQALIAAVPEPAAGHKRNRLPMRDVDPPSPLAPPAGCRFHTRCPYAQDICRSAEPPLKPVDTTGRSFACHLVDAQGDSSIPLAANASA